MGLIGKVFGGPAAVTALGDAARGVAEVFTPSATRQMELSAEAQKAALQQFGAEYADAGTGWFDRLVNGLNRLPRPMLAFGTLGLFTYAMVDPVSFGDRMVGLNLVPEPLWWLLGAVVGFYFGAREAYYFRRNDIGVVATKVAKVAKGDADKTTARNPEAAKTGASPHRDPNPALDDWRREGR